MALLILSLEVSFMPYPTLPLLLLLLPPTLVLPLLLPHALTTSFRPPTDLDVRRAETYPERQISMDNIISSLPTEPVRTAALTSPSAEIAIRSLTSHLQITNHSVPPDNTDSSHLGWLRPGDPRSELVLSLFKEGNGLPLLLNGIRLSSSSLFCLMAKPPGPRPRAPTA